MSQRNFIYTLTIITATVFSWSGINPFDRYTWWLEVLPVLIILPLLAATYRRFGLTRLLYALITLHAVILMVGGHYTYALVPAGDWVRDAFDMSRNHYDRLGHLAQGFIPAVAAREVLLRTSPLQRGKWLAFIVVSICLAFSAFYELIEWWVAEATGTGATAFLATQGDVWDTQKDMLMCAIGAIVALLTLSRAHDNQMNDMQLEETL